jgi:Trypsin
VLGDHDQLNKDEANHVDAWVTKIHMHSEFDPDSFDNDIALLELKQPIKFKKHIQPACVPSYGAKKCTEIIGLH